MTRALITGITGQDGSYLAEYLLSLGYEVWGMVRRTSSEDPLARIPHLLGKINLIPGDMLDEHSLFSAISEVRPHEVYNLAAQSFVPTSWNQPLYTAEVTGLGPVRMLEAIRQVDPSIKFYQASSSEMFGQVVESPQKETTRFHPRSPYGVAKVTAHYATVNYRESYDMFAVSGIMFNHESPRRGPEFVTRKISMGVARIKLNLANRIDLGNIEAMRDWGFAGDYVKAMHAMLQAREPKDYVVSTGQTHSVAQFVAEAFKAADTQGMIVHDDKLERPVDVHLLLGDSTRIREDLGWKPEVGFEQLVGMMVDADIERLRNASKTNL